MPAAKAALMGNTALLSLEVIPTVSVTVLARFQLASTARTVTVNTLPAVSADAVPVFPVALPGAAVSPGTRRCNLVNVLTFTVMDGLVLAVLLPSEASLAVTVALPAVLSVTLKLFVPTTSAVSAGSPAFESDELIDAVSVTFVVTFQFASTAFTVTLNAVP